MDNQIHFEQTPYHHVYLKDRKTLELTGIKKIESFDSLEFLIETSLGYLNIKGSDLALVRFDQEKKEVSIKGNIDAISYLSNKRTTKSKDSVLNKLLNMNNIIIVLINIIASNVETKNINFDIPIINIIVYSIAIVNIDVLAFPINKFPIPFSLGVTVLYIITITPSLATTGINITVQSRLLFIMLYMNPIFNNIKNIMAKREFVPNLESFIISSILSLSL
jgi:sporulation protein YabP